MGDRAIKKTKAELHAMLAEAVRNTRPQPQPEPVGDTQPEPRRKMRPATKRPKIKRVRG
jgi:hypothetical protein